MRSLAPEKPDGDGPREVADLSGTGGAGSPPVPARLRKTFRSPGDWGFSASREMESGLMCGSSEYPLEAVFVLESILTKEQDALDAGGYRDDGIDGRVAFQTDTQDEFTAAIGRLTRRRATTFLSANQTTPGVACELFLLAPTDGGPTA